ncbi:hypothetical protein GC722_17290 [Auraticoccus sp. F435]|uniref:DUF218 domain-containing protein n=1 Tax=Auraticoccus cholistanensis TaxID=2656650 RepID=A0A6A9V2F2_9ACTN|nr:ElyC/SanA/YdcF family protein [Auraticoccus cholistanensis]MVA77754.1 hypothetical protein [Auraticoccus cholistanensis]
MATITVPPRRVPWRLLAVLAALLAWVVAGAVLLGSPRVDAVEPVDALLVLAPADARLDDAAALMDAGAAGTLVLSTPGSDESSAGARACRERRSYPVVCLHPDPRTTQGEAQAFAELAGGRGWDSVAVLTQRTHLGRAGILVRRCFDGGVLQWVTSEELPASRWATRLVYETGAWVKMAVTPGCYQENGLFVPDR